MSTESIKVPNWEDIVFENRNKEYGAYIIRTKYSRNVILSAVIMLGIVGLGFAYPTIASWFKSDDVVVEDKKLTTVVQLDQPPPIQDTPPPPPKVDIPPPVKTIKYVAPKVTKEEVVEEEIPTIEEIKKTEVSTETVEGPVETVFVEPVKEVVVEDDNQVYTFVEQQAEFPGGMEAFYKFMQKNQKYPAQARRMGTEGKVFVQFVVNKDGTIQDVNVIKGVSAELDKEAARLIQLMPAWKAGKQNGKAVRVKFVLPVNFKLSN
jgi:periplasmic protein TonB